MKSSFEECGNVDLGNAPLLSARHQWLQIQKPAQRLSRVRPPPHGVELPVVCAVTIDLRLEPWPRLRVLHMVPLPAPHERRNIRVFRALPPQLAHIGNPTVLLRSFV